jgi:hypothetical protein
MTKSDCHPEGASPKDPVPQTVILDRQGGDPYKRRYEQYGSLLTEEDRNAKVKPTTLWRALLSLPYLLPMAEDD